jgi:hypothetical protein
VPLTGSCASLGSTVCPRPSPKLSRRTSPSSAASWQGHLSQQSRRCTLMTREVENTVSAILAASPQKCYGKLKQRNGTLRQCNRKQFCTVVAQTQWTQVQRPSPRNKGSHLMYPCKRVTEAKSKVEPIYGCMHLLGYITYPSATQPSSRLDSLTFLSLLCHPIPTATLSEHSLVCFFSVSSLLHTYLKIISQTILFLYLSRLGVNLMNIKKNPVENCGKDRNVL